MKRALKYSRTHPYAKPIYQVCPLRKKTDFGHTTPEATRAVLGVRRCATYTGSKELHDTIDECSFFFWWLYCPLLLLFVVLCCTVVRCCSLLVFLVLCSLRAFPGRFFGKTMHIVVFLSSYTYVCLTFTGGSQKTRRFVFSPSHIHTLSSL